MPTYAYPIASNQQGNSNQTPPSNQTSIFVQQDPPESVSATPANTTAYPAWTTPIPVQPPSIQQQYMYTQQTTAQADPNVQNQLKIWMTY